MKTINIDKKYIGRDSEPDEIEVAQQKGSYLYSRRGKKYVDFVMGWCVGSFGWDNENIKKKIQNFKGPDYVSPHQLYKPWVEYARELESLAPKKLKKSFRSTGGTESVEIALQAAMSFTERQKFISLEDGYHGDSICTRSIGSPEYGKWYKNHFSAYRIKPPLDEKSAERVALRLKKRDIAALIMEPVICNRGAMVPSQNFFDIIQEACKKSGTVLIIDEVATGFGRTGKMFACEHFHLQPDILTLGKAITGGFAPMGAVLMSDELSQAMRYETSYYSTYGWHPRSVEAALATLSYYSENRDFLETNTQEMGHYIVDQMSQMDFKEEPRFSYLGLAIGVSFEDEDYGEKIVDKAKEEGLILSEGEQGFTMFPALNIDLATVDEGLEILRRSL
ncbi:aspartate aminotransferase family protein [Bdellovibrio sp. HCB2-146]|uniref:class-III pyridoxal-phosphate-dependent aminotransferase n=1 Tax=Bdellovibrio sp. HCB2-146 TaxID=3394362 RepID=UPI0039BD45AB